MEPRGSDRKPATHLRNKPHPTQQGDLIKMSAKITIRHIEDVTVLEVSGRITLGDGGVTLRDSIQNALKAGARKLVVDMGDVNYMDSSGVGELTGAYTSAKNRGCDLKLVRLTRKLDGLMQITKLATLFDIYANEKEAIASFPNDRPAAA